MRSACSDNRGSSDSGLSILISWSRRIVGGNAKVPATLSSNARHLVRVNEQHVIVAQLGFAYRPLDGRLSLG
jgi:hypothetical protein